MAGLQGLQATVAEIRNLVREEMEAKGIVGASLALADQDSLLWAEGFGYSTAGGEPATSGTIYMTGSISKVLAATAIMKLVEERRVGLDQPMTMHLPEFCMRSRFSQVAPITVRSVLCHSSGLPVDWLHGTRPERGRSPIPAREITEALSEEYLVDPPDRMSRYSNLGYSLIEDLIGRASGMDYADYVGHEILAPLDMTHSFFGLEASRSQSWFNGCSISEAYAKGCRVTGYDAPAAAGGLYASVLDLCKLAQMVLNRGRSGSGRSLLSRDTIEEMLAPQNQTTPLNLYEIGLGWHLRPLELGREVWHNGATTFFHSMMSILPEQGLALALMANSAEASGLVNTTYSEILRIVCGADALKGTQANPPASTEEDPCGDYASALGLVSVTGGPGRLKLQLRPEVSLPLEINTRGAFDIVGAGGVSVSFLTLCGARVLALAKDRTCAVVGAQVHPVEVPPAWERRVGSYRIANRRPGDFDLFTHLTVDKRGSYLVFNVGELGSPAQFALEPLSDEEAVTMGLGPGMGETVRVLGAGTDSERLAFQGLVLRKEP